MKAKKTKADDLTGKTADELHALLLDQRKAQMNLRFQRSGGQLEKTHEMRTVRRTIARIKTLLQSQRAKAPSASAKSQTKKAAKPKTKAA
ncbi:MAG: 50S ribosomal protein L29 [Alphaproteobacteria bacterium]|nr:50S ribosomal protein L29 [Alphaproteobacteria bacterium]